MYAALSSLEGDTYRHTTKTLSFLPIGHTKFSPDWCFSVFKHKVRQTRVDCLQSVPNMAEISQTKTSLSWFPWNHHYTYIWVVNHLYSKNEKNSEIKKLQLLQISSSSPRCVFACEWSKTEEKEIKLRKDPWISASEAFPAIFPPHTLNTSDSNLIMDLGEVYTLIIIHWQSLAFSLWNWQWLSKTLNIPNITGCLEIYIQGVSWMWFIRLP